MKRTQLKRGAGLKRGKPLARSTPLRRDVGLSPGMKIKVLGTAPDDFRKAVYAASGGRCVATGVRLPPDGGIWSWHAHHCVPKAKLPDRLKYEPRLGVALTKRAHERHTTRTEVIPYEALPERVRAFVATLDYPYVSYLLREHPPREKLAQPQRPRRIV